MADYLVYVPVLLHVIGGFYAQPAFPDKMKAKYGAVALRCLLYAAVFCAGAAAFWSAPAAAAFAVFALFHFGVESLLYLCQKRRRGASEPFLYGLDQALHATGILIFVAVFRYYNLTVSLLPGIVRVLSLLTAEAASFLQWLCILLIILRPVNVTIKHLLAQYRPDGDTPGGVRNVGALIGALERIIIVLLLRAGQYSAIGLVLTAKSVARYDKISKDQTFAEYYLLGTLLSTLSVILTYFLFT